MFKRIISIAAAAALSLTCFAAPSQAAWPERPVKFLLGSAAGSSIDTVGRLLADRLSKKFNQPFVPQNVTGGGNGALTMVLKNSPADGYTISFGADSFFAFNSLVKGAQFKAEDFEYVAGVFSADAAWICTPDKPWKNLREALEWAKANNKTLVYQSQTRSDNLMTQMIAEEMGVKIDIVPAKGPSAIITSLLGNHCDLGYSGGLHYEQDRAGKIKTLTLNSPTPSIIFKDAPLSKDQFKNVAPHRAVRVVVVPKGFPEDVRKVLEKALEEICTSEDFNDLVLNKLHFIPEYQDSATATKELMAYRDYWAGILNAQK
ncbi:MAG: tripartite tricarboxylate transporter substrate binding protein [Mailhella sp.]|nr:tripartite tricarboxylate transporter substrate binding protein [Mailhella sp.]